MARQKRKQKTRGGGAAEKWVQPTYKQIDIASVLSSPVPRGNLRPGTMCRIPETLYRRYFKKLCDAKDLVPVRFGVHDNGSCFFYAVAAALNAEQFHSRTLKEQDTIGKNVRKGLNMTITDDVWRKYWNSRTERPVAGGAGTGVGGFASVPDAAVAKERMANPSTWSDVYMILYTMGQLGINIVFMDLTSGEMYCGVHSEHPNAQTIMIAWVGRCHFEPIFMYDRKKDIMRLHFAAGDPIAKAINDQYNKQCSRTQLAV